jgi:hypothetical protein
MCVTLLYFPRIWMILDDLSASPVKRREWRTNVVLASFVKADAIRQSVPLVPQVSPGYHDVS